MLKVAAVGKESYHQAACVQFSNFQEYSEKLNITITSVQALLFMYPKLINDEETAISNTGHTRLDLKKLRDMKMRVSDLLTNLLTFKINGESYLEKIALPSWRNLLFESLGEMDITK